MVLPLLLAGAALQIERPPTRTVRNPAPNSRETLRVGEVLRLLLPRDPARHGHWSANVSLGETNAQFQLPGERPEVTAFTLAPSSPGEMSVLFTLKASGASGGELARKRVFFRVLPPVLARTILLSGALSGPKVPTTVTVRVGQAFRVVAPQGPDDCWTHEYPMASLSFVREVTVIGPPFGTGFEYLATAPGSRVLAFEHHNCLPTPRPRTRLLGTRRLTIRVVP